MLLNKRGIVKLTDFGISKELENSIEKAMTIVGTFKYMSPERILGRDYSGGGHMEFRLDDASSVPLGNTLLQK